MVLTGERIVLAVAAFGLFMYMQRRQRKMSDRFMQNIQQRQNGRPEEPTYIDMQGEDQDEDAEPDADTPHKTD
ncbi:MAG: hypothetical protein OWT28_04110 [Firmicutes bacterium]|nr:hypothetical protein [Bacillota bacterium]